MNKDSFTSSVPILDAFLFIVLTRTSSPVLSRRENSHPYLVPNLSRESIQFFTINSDVICRFFIDILLTLLCWEFLSGMHIGYHEMFFLLIELIILFFFFSVLIMVNYICWFLNIKGVFISGIDPTWSWCIIPFICCLLWFVDTLSRSFHIYILRKSWYVAAL